MLKLPNRSQGVKKPKLVLASGSPYRLKLLQERGFEAEPVASNVAEPDLQTFPDLESGLVSLAYLKGSAVSRSRPGELILAADTISLVQGEILGKPTDRNDAERMLRQMSGIAHEVWTGWCLISTRGNFAVTGVEKTKLLFRTWTEEGLQTYLAGGEWEGKCGAYGLEWPHDPMVETLEGSVSNVIGLPMERIEAVLARFPGLNEDHFSGD